MSLIGEVILSSFLIITSHIELQIKVFAVRRTYIMNMESLNALLRAVSTGSTTVEKAAEKLKNLSVEDIEYAHIDHHRSLRKGFPEVIFGEGKTAGQITGIMERMLVQEQVVLVTRVTPNKADKIITQFPEAKFYNDAGMIIWKNSKIPILGKGKILVISAGTSDIPVAKEAYLTAKAMGNEVNYIYDVGVAGIHRLFKH